MRALLTALVLAALAACAVRVVPPVDEAFPVPRAPYRVELIEPAADKLAVEAALLAVAGVERVDIDPDARHARVSVMPDVMLVEAAVRGALHQSGFELAAFGEPAWSRRAYHVVEVSGGG